MNVKEYIKRKKIKNKIRKERSKIKKLKQVLHLLDLH